MRLPHHLRKASNGIYYFRLNVPSTLRPQFGKLEIIQSLGTRDPMAAKAWAYALSAKFAVEFQRLRTMPKPSVSDVLKSARAGETTDYTITLPNGMSITANDAADHAMALESIGRLDQVGAFKAAPVAPAMPSIPGIEWVQLSQGIKRHLDFIEGKSIPKTFGIKKKALKEFQYWKKDVALPSITRTDMADYCQFLLDQLARNTVTNKFTYLKLFFEDMQSKGLYPRGDNPAHGQISFGKKERRKRKKKGSEIFTPAELATIFTPDKFLKFKKPNEYWAPLIGLFTGARVSEICQMNLDDFLKIDGIPCFRITDEGAEQSLKTDASNRIVPIHPKLLDLGLLDYVASLRKQGYTQLFPNLQKGLNGFGDAQSKAFIRHVKREKVTPKAGKKSFHSFRTTLTQKLQDHRIAPDYRCQYLGHDLDDEHFQAYSRTYTVRELTEVIHPALDFEIDFSSFKQPPGKFDGAIKRMVKINAKKMSENKINNNLEQEPA
jgi:integrase